MTHHKIIIYNSLKMKMLPATLVHWCKNTMVLKLILLHHKNAYEIKYLWIFDDSK